MKLLVQQNEIGGKRKTAAATKQLELAQERIAEVSRIIKRLYEDNVNGKISDERFMELSADYETEQAELKREPPPCKPNWTSHRQPPTTPRNSWALYASTLPLKN